MLQSEWKWRKKWKHLTVGEGKEQKVRAGSSRWAIMGDDVRSLIVEERGIAQGPAARPSCSAQGQEAGEDHCKKLNRAEPNRMRAAPICSAPPPAEGFLSMTPLVLGKRRLYFEPHFTDGVRYRIQKCSFLSPVSLEQAGRGTIDPQTDISA